MACPTKILMKIHSSDAFSLKMKESSKKMGRSIREPRY